TRQKLKEAYDIHSAAVIERAEKQTLLARHMRRLLLLLDDTPVVPGDVRPPFEHAAQARQILIDAEEDLREWQPSLEPVPSSAVGMGTNLMPPSVTEGTSSADPSVVDDETISQPAQAQSSEKRDVTGTTVVQPDGSGEYPRQ
ncbi:MAG: hypothetical protein Q9214_007438, partial [Letrouitia sp. 1 TL-2023]